MECKRLKNWHVFWNNRKKFSTLDLDGGYIGNRYTLYIFLYVQLKKIKETHIEDMEIITPLGAWSIKPNDSMTQPLNIQCWKTNQSWGKKKSNDQDLAVYTLEIKWPPLITNSGVGWFICGYSLCSVGYHIFTIDVFNV